MQASIIVWDNWWGILLIKIGCCLLLREKFFLCNIIRLKIGGLSSIIILCNLTFNRPLIEIIDVSRAPRQYLGRSLLILHIEFLLSTWSPYYYLTLLLCDNFFNGQERRWDGLLSVYILMRDISFLPEGEGLLLVGVVSCDQFVSLVIWDYLGVKFGMLHLLRGVWVLCVLNYLLKGIRDLLLLGWNHNWSWWIAFYRFIEEIARLVKMRSTTLLSRKFLIIIALHSIIDILKLLLYLLIHVNRPGKLLSLLSVC